MKFRSFTLAASMVLAVAAAAPALAQDVPDGLSDLSTYDDSQLGAATGSVVSQQSTYQDQFAPGGSGTSSPAGLGQVGTNQTQGLTGSTGTLGTNSLAPVSGPINMGLGYVSGDIGVELPTIPQ